MTKRTYHQYCPMAYMLNIVGERWTLLLVRELYFGPRRFTDLLNGLPGIGSNLLSQRLKHMEQAGLIRQRTLPPPAGSTVYELTETGAALKAVLAVLAKNGLRYLQTSPPVDDFVGVVPAMLTVEKFFNPAKASGVEITCQIHLAAEIFFADVHDDLIEVGQGPLRIPTLVIHTEPRILIQLLTGYLQLEQAISEDRLQIKAGNRENLKTFIELFDFPHQPDL